MKRLLPSLWLSLGLWGGWLLLNRSLSPGQLLLGAAVAVVLPLLMAPLRPRPGPLRHWGVLMRLILRVGGDVVSSAVEVAAAVLRAKWHPPNGVFVVVPLACATRTRWRHWR